MAKVELYRKYRPQNLSEMVGNEATIKSLKAELENGSHVFLFTGPAGCGKAQPLDSLVLTKKGYVRMGDVSIGMKILDGKGNETEIEGVYPQGKRDIYKITFNDRTSIKVADDHINRVFWYNQNKKQREYFDLTTLELIEKFNNQKYKLRVDVPVIDCWEKSELPLNPYLLGLLLADGCLHNNFNVTIAENDVKDKISNILSEIGYKLNHIANYDYRIIREEKKTYNQFVQDSDGLRFKIKELGLNCKSIEKFIPKEYLYNSHENRLELLRGLFDGDGFIGKNGSCYFDVCSKKLSDDFAFLVRSLGIVDTVGESIAKYKCKNNEVKETSICYRHYLRVPNNLRIFSSKKHNLRWHKKQTEPIRKIEKIEKVSNEECQCIYVSSVEHTYLTNNITVTHNTTLARIIAKEVGAGDLSIKEINSAENRGIDTAREVQEQMRYNPSDGEALVWIFDECFHKDTLIDTLRGRVKISEVTPNELVFNSDGVTRVETVQKKKVDVNRLVILTTNYGQLLTTREHLFYTNGGFVKAEKLVKGDVLYDIQDMPNMWKGISNVSVNKFRNLRKCLWWVATQTERVIGETEEILFRYEREKQERIDLPSVWEDFYSSGKRPSEVLFDILQSYWTKAYNGSISESGMCDLWERIQREALEQEKDLFKKLSVYLDGFEFCWQEMFGKEKTTDDGKQSVKKSLCLAKDERYKNKEWNTAYLEWKAWRERSVYERADDIIQTVGGGVVFRVIDKNSQKITISDELQGRYRESIFENCDRSGRSDPQFSEATCVGLKENEFVGSVRVESVEIYQSADKSKSFRCYFTDKELSDGVVDMYDLGVEGSPTYYANGVLVHNCHQWLAPVQNAFLKALEDTPEHVYFFLCTTDPQKLITPLKTRCSIINVTPLNNEEMTYLLKRTARAEKIKMGSEVYERICELAQGGSRKGLKLLSKVLYLESDEERLEVLKIGDSSDNPETIELCRTLLQKGCTWSKLAFLLKTLDLSEPERVRQAVMGYMNSVLLNGKASAEAVSAIQAFSSADTYKNGKFGITVACLDYLSLLE